MMKNKLIDNLDNIVKDYITFGKVYIKKGKDGYRSLTEEEIQEFLDSNSYTTVEHLTAEEIVEKYSDILTKENLKQLAEVWADKEIDNMKNQFKEEIKTDWYSKEEVLKRIRLQLPIAKFNRVDSKKLHYTFNVSYHNETLRVGFNIEVPIDNIKLNNFYNEMEVVHLIKYIDFENVARFTHIDEPILL